MVNNYYNVELTMVNSSADYGQQLNVVLTMGNNYCNVALTMVNSYYTMIALTMVNS